MVDQIIFKDIPDDVLVPGVYTELDDSNALTGTPVLPQRVLVLGSRLAAGTVLAGVITRITGDRDGENFFGKGSLLHGMIDVARGFSEPAKRVELHAIAVDDDGGAVDATGTITLVGTATADGVIDIRIAGRRVRTPISTGDDQTVAATAVTASDHTETPTSVGNVLGVITYTARNGGETGNDIDLRVDVLPAGITATVVPMASGATNPDITATIALIISQQWTSIISAYSDDANLDLLEAEMERRDGPLVDLPGHVFGGFRGDLAAALVFGAARNSRHSTVIHLADTPSPPWELASWGTMADETESDPARPRNGIAGTVRPSSGADVPGIAPPAPEDKLIAEDDDSLLHSGITPLQADDFDRITVVRMITTFQQDDLGTASRIYLDITTPRTLDAIRFTTKLRFRTRYPRHKLADDGGPLIANVITPSIGRSEVLALHDDTWVPEGWVEGGKRGDFSDNLVVERDSSDVNRLNFLVPPDLVNGAHVFAFQIQFRL